MALVTTPAQLISDVSNRSSYLQNENYDYDLPIALALDQISEVILVFIGNLFKAMCTRQIQLVYDVSNGHDLTFIVNGDTGLLYEGSKGNIDVTQTTKKINISGF